MKINNKTIAVMIDFDNFNQEEHLKMLFIKLEKMGNIVYKGAFYSNTKDKDVETKGIKYGINDFIVEPAYSEGKNAVDIRIALETMELLNKEYIDCFCLATNDSDFAPIIKKLKQRNKIVIGAGSKANNDYQKLCHEFIIVNTIAEACKIKETETVDVIELVRVFKEIIISMEDKKDSQGFIFFSVFVKKIYEKISNDDLKKYGFPVNRISQFFKKKLNAYFLLKTEEKTTYIKIQP